MKTYRVREIRKYTGLSRKQLYDYEKSIPPIDRENSAGYKIYDQEGLEKLSLAALFAELGAGPQRINDIFGADDYDSRQVIEDLIDEATRERNRLDDIILIAEDLKECNLSGFTFNLLQVSDLHETAETIRRELQSDDAQKILNDLDEKTSDSLMELYKSFDKYEGDIDLSEELDDDIQKILAFAEKELGLSNPSKFLFNQSVALTRNNMIREYVDKKTRKGLSDVIANAIREYQYGHLFKDCEELISDECWDALERGDYSSESVKSFAVELPKVIKRWIGIDRKNEVFSIMFRPAEILFEQQEDDENDEIAKLFGTIEKAVDYHYYGEGKSNEE